MFDSATVDVVFSSPGSRHLSAVISEGPQESNIAEIAKRSLRASANPGVWTLQCEHHEGVLVLRGRVSSYYHKQLAQEAVRNLCGVDAILNNLEVVWPIDA